jgi:hypothetical protein
MNHNKFEVLPHELPMTMMNVPVVWFVEVLLLGELFLCEVFLLGQGGLFLLVLGSTMFCQQDGLASQPPPENRANENCCVH